MYSLRFFRPDNALFLGYYKGDPNGGCQNVKDIIDHPIKCLEAEEALSINLTNYANTWSDSDSGALAGCYIRGDRRHFIDSNFIGDISQLFEDSTDGVGGGRLDLIPLCYKKGKIFSRNLKYYQRSLFLDL